MLVEDLIVSGERKDYRSTTSSRDISVKHFPNLVEVASSGSAVIINYSRGTTQPYPDRPSEGIFQFAISGKKNDVLMNFLHNVYIKSRCVVLDMIKFNQIVECVTININIIETNGDLYRLCIAGTNEIIKHLGLKRMFLPEYFNYCSVFDTLVLDGADQEQRCSEWSIHVVMKSTREMLYVEKVGKPADSSEVLKAVNYAFKAVL